jgi:hypothetical protein
MATITPGRSLIPMSQLLDGPKEDSDETDDEGLRENDIYITSDDDDDEF